VAQHTIDRLQPGDTLGRSDESRRVWNRQRPPGVVSCGELQFPFVRTPQAYPSSDECTQTLEQVIEPPYWRRSIMQMEFPRSLNCTASTSLRMR
jgi:hypothetical protein